MANDYTQLLDNVFSAVDVIAQKRVETLDFNKTIKCSIVDNTNAEKGEYTVTDGSATFLAYSEKRDYKIGAYVYVLIPNGDYAQQKMIVGKYVTVASEYYTYVKPSDAFINITNNIITSDLNTTELTANSSVDEIEIWSASNLKLSLYDRLLIKSDFQTWLSSYHLDDGDYGVKMIVTIWHKPDQSLGGETLFKEFELNTSNMYGDPYNFETYYGQEALYDISDISDKTYQITGIKLIAFQKQNFARNEVLINASPTPNIFIKSPIISFGYALEDFQDDKVLLGTFNGDTYATYLTPARKEELNINPGASPEELEQYINTYNSKDIYVRWVHQNDIVSNNGKTNASIGASNFIAIQDISKLPSDTCVHWYRYNLNEGIRDDLAGAFWQEIPEYKNKFNISGFIPDTTQAFDQIKVIIEQPLKETLDKEAANLKNYQQRKIYAETYSKFKDDEISLHNAIAGLGLSLTNEEFAIVAEEFLAEISKIYSKQILYESDILTFTNESPVADKATWDLIKGLTLDVDRMGYQGVYRIYDELGDLYSSGESVKKRIITAKYTSLVTGQPELDTAEEITWTIPTRNTMIYTPEDGVEFDSNYDKVTTDDDENIIITRYGIVSSSEPGTEEADTAQQYFRIKDHYSQTLINNTIHCKLVKNNVVYEADAYLSFGPAGTNGTDYTMTLEFKGKHPAITISQDAREQYDAISAINAEIDVCLSQMQNEIDNVENDPTISRTEKDKKIDKINSDYQVIFDEKYEQIDLLKNQIQSNENASMVYVVPHIFDFEGREITARFESDDFKYEWYTSGKNGISIHPFEDWTEEEQENNPEVGAIKLVASSDIELCQWYILKVSLKNAATVAGDTVSRATITLNAYLPIPIRFAQTYTAIDGADRIAYNSSGVMPQYYKDPYKLYSYENGRTVEVQGVSWSMNYGDSAAQSDAAARFYPRVTQDGKITVPSMFLRDVDNHICVNAYLGSQLVWTQPIYIYQNVYDSAMLNAWDGSLTFDEENGTILSAMVGAGKKNSDNTFSGVLMGQLSKARSSSDTGLYGYDHGVQSFGLNIDGSAFFGASGNGRIEINGTKGTISSSNYEVNSQGMKIDLNEGTMITKHNSAMVKIDPTNADGYFTIRSEDSVNLMTVGSDGYYLQSNDYPTGHGMRIDLDEGQIRATNFTLEAVDTGRIRLSTNSPYFYVNNGSHNLIYMADESYYLESSNWGNNSGFRLDLNDGTMTAYDNFTLTATNGSQGMIISSTGTTAISIFGTGSIQLNYDGSIVTNGCRIDPQGAFWGANDLFKIDMGGLGWALPGFLFDIADGASLFNGNGKGSYYKFGGKSATIGPWHIDTKGIYSTTSFKNSPCVLEPDGEFKFKAGDMRCQFSDGHFWIGRDDSTGGLSITEDLLKIAFSGYGELTIGNAVTGTDGYGDDVSTVGLAMTKGSSYMSCTAGGFLGKCGNNHVFVSSNNASLLNFDSGATVQCQGISTYIGFGNGKSLLRLQEASAQLHATSIYLDGTVYIGETSLDDYIKDAVDIKIGDIDFSKWLTPGTGTGTGK